MRYRPVSQAIDESQHAHEQRLQMAAFLHMRHERVVAPAPDTFRICTLRPAKNAARRITSTQDGHRCVEVLAAARSYCGGLSAGSEISPDSSSAVRTVNGAPVVFG